MKRFVAIWVAVALFLCCACAGAEDRAVTVPTGESEGWRLSNDMIVDTVLLHDILERLCPNWLLRKGAEKAGILLNAIEPSLTVARDGLQLDIDLNGKKALSIGGMRTDDGVLIASTLFPNYVISVSTGRVTEIISDISPMVARPKSKAKIVSDEAGPALQTASPEDGADGGEAAPSATQPTDPDETLPVEEMSQYVSVTAPEDGEYLVDGVRYDVRRTFNLDCDGIVGAWNTFVDWVFKNKGVTALLEIARKAELEVDIDQVKTLLSADALPRLSATSYSSAATGDRLITATAASSDGTKVYGDARIRITEDEVTASIRLSFLPLDIDFQMNREEGLRAELDLRGKEPLLHATLVAEEGPKGQLEVSVGGTYLGSDFEVVPFDASGEGFRLTASLYYTDERNPIFREEFTLQPHGTLTLDFTDAKKMLVPLTSLFNISSGQLVGFALDIALNGIGGLLDATTSVLTQIKQLPEQETDAAKPAA